VQRERYRIRDLQIDVETFSVTREGAEVSLPGLSFDLLLALARAAPRVVESDRLVEEVWRGTAVSDETLTQRVALLRRALGDDAREPRYVRSVRGRGYCLIPDVMRLEGAELPGPRPFHRRLGWQAAAAGAAVLVVLLTASWWRGDEPGAKNPPALRTTPTSAEDLLARADEYLARHQEADNELALDLYRQALEIEPDHPDALAGLSFGMSQRATKFSRGRAQRREALALAERAVAAAPLSGAAHHARALALDSLGRYSAALAEYERASILDPGRLWAASSAAYIRLVQGRLAEALEANVRVAGGEELTPYSEVQLGTTLAVLGFEAEATVWLERALRLRPDNVFAALAYARVRLGQGRVVEAEELAAAAIARGIRRPELHIVLGNIALLAGDESAARSAYLEALEIDSRLDEARARLLILDHGSAEEEVLEVSYVEMTTALRAGRSDGDESPEGAFLEGLLHAAFGRRAGAFEALDGAIGLGYRDSGWLGLDPMLESLRGDPAFERRVEQIRELIAAERRSVESAPWLPAGFLDS
jgi:DNA-binding winged helix-turn-helix (wHTH) protein/Tfp pilus assembly protein PilF